MSSSFERLDSNMSGTLPLPLFKGQVTMENALDDDDNMLARISYPQKKWEFWNYLSDCKA